MSIHDIDLIFWPTVVACLFIGLLTGYGVKRHIDKR